MKLPDSILPAIQWYLWKIIKFLMIVGCFSELRAETIVQKRFREFQRLYPLKKITVGPHDQYHADINRQGNLLVFTQKIDLIAHISWQDLSSGEIGDLILPQADSQDPVFDLNQKLQSAKSSADDSKRIAFTYFKNNARGEICYGDIPDTKSKLIEGHGLRCLKTDEPQGMEERGTPFWAGPEKIGYVVRNLQTQLSQIVVEDILSSVKKVLAKGKVESPAFDFLQNRLVFSETTSSNSPGQRQLVILNLGNGSREVLKLNLPGVPGFPTFAGQDTTPAGVSKKTYLYFSHYLNDTNHDQVIDANDHSVLFRIPLGSPEKTFGGNGELFPEQLTSSETNCSFPRVWRDKLYATCAFEGSLDIYEIPSEGVVPKNWTEEKIWNVHRSSRSYAERVLLINVLKYRFSQKSKQELLKLEEKLFSNHALAGDITAAKFYLKLLGNEELSTDQSLHKSLYKSMMLFLEATELLKSQPSEEVSQEFLRKILEIEKKLLRLEPPGALKLILVGLLNSYIGRFEKSLQTLGQLEGLWGNSQNSASVLERMLALDLARVAFLRLSDQERIKRLSDFFLLTVNAKELTVEQRVFIAVQWIQFLEKKNPSGEGMKRELSERLEIFTNYLPKLSDPAKTLFQAEISALHVASASSDEEKSTKYRALDLIMSQARDNFYLRKALGTRAISVFTEYLDFKYLNYVALQWLRYTEKEDAEFPFAREVVLNSSLDRAYHYLGKGELEFAGNFFYGSLSLTDDLESHSGYIRAMIERGQRNTIDQRYQNLSEREFIGDNQKFVVSLLSLMDAQSSTAQKTLDEMITNLGRMQQDRDSPIRYLLLGYCYLEKMMRSLHGFDFRQDDFKSSHRNLMLAYDLGRDNVRLKASALINLGLLHYYVRNYGLAEKFFTLRKNLGFQKFIEEVGFTWVLAHSHYHQHSLVKAIDELKGVLEKKEFPNQWRNIFQERLAFYYQASGQFKLAREIYEALLSQENSTHDKNLSKMYLSYGYVLFKLNEKGLAKTAFFRSLQHLENFEKMKEANPDARNSRLRAIDFNPKRIQLSALGFLAQIETGAEQQKVLERRLALLGYAQSLLENQLPQKMQTHLHLANLQLSTSPGKSFHHLSEALGLAREFGASTQYLGNSVYRVITSYLSVGITHPRLFFGKSQKPIYSLLESVQNAYQLPKNSNVLLYYQSLKLDLLWMLFLKKVDPKNSEVVLVEKKIEQVLSSEKAKKIKIRLPDAWRDLEKLLNVSR